MWMKKLKDNKLSSWAEALRSLGFEDRYYGYISFGITDIDWYDKDKIHVNTSVCLSKEYDEYLQTLDNLDNIDLDWARCDVVDISIETKEFSYNSDYMHWLHGDAIVLTQNYIENFNSLTYDNFLYVLYMVKNPISAKVEITQNFIIEVKTFLHKHEKMLLDLGWEQNSCDLLSIKPLISTEPSISFIRRRKESDTLIDLSFRYNMFTKKLVFIGDAKSGCAYYSAHEYNVNDLTTEELKQLIIEYMKYFNML